MKRPAGSPSVYGRRGKGAAADNGSRRVAPTYGKAEFLVSSQRASGSVAVESAAERVAAHLLSICPQVTRFEAQPFAVDLIEHSLLTTREAVSRARAKHRHRVGPLTYTPDFLVIWPPTPQTALEVKFAGFDGKEEYAATLQRGREVLEAMGYRLRRLTVPFSSAHPIRRNAVLLHHALARHDLRPTREQAERVEQTLGNDEVPMGELCRLLELSPNLIPVYLVCGVLAGDLARHPLCSSMPLRAAWGDLAHLNLIDEVLR